MHDQYRQYYHRGIDKQRPDFPSLISYLRQEIERLSPKKVLRIGTSARGYAAIRADHQLRTDHVQAFGSLTEALAIANPDRLGEIAKAYFHDDL